MVWCPCAAADVKCAVTAGGVGITCADTAWLPGVVSQTQEQAVEAAVRARGTACCPAGHRAQGSSAAGGAVACAGAGCANLCGVTEVGGADGAAAGGYPGVGPQGAGARA